MMARRTEMAYAERLRKLFTGIDLTAEDLLFLEPFQIDYLPGRVPPHEFSVMLQARPVISRYLYAAGSSIRSFIDRLPESTAETSTEVVKESIDELLWEIADLIVYSRYPEVYDRCVNFPWKIEELIAPCDLESKTIIDAGAGPGRLSFQVAAHARAVFALEPAKGFRNFIRNKAKKSGIRNIYTLEGFLDSIPLPDHSADYLLTSQAIGWNLQSELCEIERVLKPGGAVFHLFKGVAPDDVELKTIHRSLTSPEWNYKLKRFSDSEEGVKLKYYKNL